MKTAAILDELMVLAGNAGYKIIKDKGAFRGGACIVHEQKIILLNKRLPPESMVAVLARVVGGISDNIFLKPAIREVIERERRPVSHRLVVPQEQAATPQ